MIQIELYTRYLEENSKIFQNVFGYKVIESFEGFVKFECGNSELMLFDPSLSSEESNHWDITKYESLGIGAEVILVVEDINEVFQRINDQGYKTTNLTKKPWGTTEFEFDLKDGYLIRVKQL
jgi:uncharacterized glyoxalase superfamily protein PhnB